MEAKAKTRKAATIAEQRKPRPSRRTTRAKTTRALAKILLDLNGTLRRQMQSVLAAMPYEV